MLQAARLMLQHRISGLPVVDGDRPVGILTHRDIRFETRLDRCKVLLVELGSVDVVPGELVGIGGDPPGSRVVGELGEGDALFGDLGGGQSGLGQ